VPVLVLPGSTTTSTSTALIQSDRESQSFVNRDCQHSAVVSAAASLACHAVFCCQAMPASSVHLSYVITVTTNIPAIVAVLTTGSRYDY
jgi:hypothetical protein